jgi:predicted small lipoprotein YifL
VGFSNQKRIVGFITISVLGLAMLTGCGFKGPLYLPPPPDTLGGKTQKPSEQSVSPTSGQMGVEVSPYSPFLEQNPSLEPAPRTMQ